MNKQLLAALGLITVMGMSGCVAPEALEALVTESAQQVVDAVETEAAAVSESSGAEATELTPAQLTALARITDYGPAPELVNDVWINSEPLRLADLRGNVVIVEFWTYG